MDTICGIRNVWYVRSFAAVTALLLLVTFIICMAKGSDNPTSSTFLLGINVLYSSMIGGIIARWYNVGELHSSKLWYVLSLGCLLIVQSIVYDAYAFHYPILPDQTSTVSPSITTPEINSTSDLNSTILL